MQEQPESIASYVWSDALQDYILFERHVLTEDEKSGKVKPKMKRATKKRIAELEAKILAEREKDV